MGVRYLTSYVKNVERNVSSQVRFDCNQSAEKSPTFVIDGWAMIFATWTQYFGDAIRTLDYEQYKEVFRRIVKAWLSAGVNVVFVFDGPMLPSKLQTAVRRLSDRVACNQGYMHSSNTSRVARGLQSRSNVFPVLLYSATIDVVKSLSKEGVEIVFAPTEADSLVAEIASQRNRGYAFSQDSDFFILCSRGQGCAGYAPLDTLEYIVEPASSSANGESSNDVDVQDDDGFEQVGKKRRGKARNAFPTNDIRSRSEVAQSSPPLSEEEGKLLAIRFRAYRPQDLAEQLNIPPALLPLFAAIIGNDHSTATQSNLLLRHVDTSQRIQAVAAILQREWIKVKSETKASSGVTSRRGQTRLAMTTAQDLDDGRSDPGSSATATPTRNTPGPTRAASSVVPVDPVRAMVESIVDKLLAQADTAPIAPRHFSSGERELIVDSIIDAAATYTLLTHSNAPHLASPSALFFGDAIPLLANANVRQQEIAFPRALERYRKAYDLGWFKRAAVEILTQRVYLSWYSPEDPDQASVNVQSVREIRQSLYSVLFEVWGMSWARKEWQEPERDDSENQEADESRPSLIPDRTYRDGEKPDDVISVDTESSSEHGSEDAMQELPSRPGSVAALERESEKPPPGVVEYVRTGTLCTGQLVRIRSVKELLRYGADWRVRGELDNADTERKTLPTSLADLLAQHEASQPALQDDNEPSSDPIPAPIALQPLDLRLEFFLFAHHANNGEIKALPVEHYMTACVLRMLIVSETKRLGQHRKRVNWSRAEVRVAVQSMILSQEVTAAERRHSLVEQANLVYPTVRAIHLASAIQLMLDASDMLAGALLLPLDERRWTRSHSCFFAPLFHLGMARIHEGAEASNGNVPEASTAAVSIENAILQGIENDLGIDALDLKRERKAKKKEAKLAQQQQQLPSKSASVASRSRSVAAKNAFALLQDAE